MKFLEIVRLFYGTMMGTSTQYLKTSKRHLFPTKQIKVDSNIRVFIGGSANCAYFQNENILVNPGSGQAANHIFDQLNSDQNLKGLTIICTQPFDNYSAGTALYAEADKIFCGQPLSSDMRCEVLEKDTEIKGLQIKVLENTYSERDLYIEACGGKVVLTGALLYNQIHPPLYMDSGVHFSKWKEQLNLWGNSDVDFIPGEGEMAKGSEVSLFLDYLNALENPEVEFSFCRQNYDWAEIIGFTSLEENFDLIRNKIETHARF